MSTLTVSGLRFSPATAEDSARGLLGFVSFLLNDAVRIDGVTLRRTLGGALTLAWPAREDRLGQRHALIKPISDAARRDVERQVFEQLRIGGAP